MTQRERSLLTHELASVTFQSHYWLKTELADFCRTYALPTGGGKLELAGRVAAFLEKGEVASASAPVRRQTVSLTEPLSPETVIPDGCRSSQTLRAYFLGVLGKGFHFNAFMRHYLRDNAGRTLADAAEAWRADQAEGPVKREIEPQFEFNRHIRAYHQQYPKATRAEAIAAWKRERLRPDLTKMSEP